MKPLARADTLGRAVTERGTWFSGCPGHDTADTRPPLHSAPPLLLVFRVLPFPMVSILQPCSSPKMRTTSAVQLQYLQKGKTTKAALNPPPVCLGARWARVPPWRSQPGQINESRLPFPDGSPQDSRAALGKSQLSGVGYGEPPVRKWQGAVGCDSPARAHRAMAPAQDLIAGHLRGFGASCYNNRALSDRFCWRLLFAFGNASDIK